jgi:hypothetical protein
VGEVQVGFAEVTNTHTYTRSLTPVAARRLGGRAATSGGSRGGRGAQGNVEQQPNKRREIT